MTLKEQLIRDEGTRLKPYMDTTGHVTIGFGRNLTDVGISLAEAEYLLDHDIARASADLQAALPWTVNLNEPRRAALINMSFNLGITGLLAFHKMLAACQAGDWTQAGFEALNSEWARQVGPRAYRLSRQLETGAWV